LGLDSWPSRSSLLWISLTPKGRFDFEAGRKLGAICGCNLLVDFNWHNRRPSFPDTNNGIESHASMCSHMELKGQGF
jgi:hypothetical protein